MQGKKQSPNVYFRRPAAPGSLSQIILAPSNAAAISAPSNARDFDLISALVVPRQTSCPRQTRIVSPFTNRVITPFPATGPLGGTAVIFNSGLPLRTARAAPGSLSHTVFSPSNAAARSRPFVVTVAARRAFCVRPCQTTAPFQVTTASPFTDEVAMSPATAEPANNSAASQRISKC